jgi:hypothetical protein
MKKLSDFDPNTYWTPIDLSEVENKGDVLVFINNMVENNLTPLLLSKIFSDAAAVLNMTSTFTEDDVMDRLNDFSYNFKINPFFEVTT